jgi:hypothetical protein
VERDDAGYPGDPGEQRRDVRESDDGLGPACQRLEVHALDDASDAVAAAKAPYRIDIWVAERSVEVGQAIRVGSGQVAVSPVCMGTYDRFVIQRTAELFGPRYIIPLK